MADIRFCNITIVGTSHSDVGNRVLEVLKAIGEIRRDGDGKGFRVSISLSKSVEGTE